MNAQSPRNQVATTPPPAIVQIDGLFKQHRKAIEDALPKHLTADRMMRIALTELRKTPRLQQCDMLSFLGAVVQACQLGLEPGGALGHCYLIPYGKECQLQLGYRGMVDLARRSGNIVSISARAVYPGDKFDVNLGTDEHIQHTPGFGGGEPLLYYAVAKLKDGGIQFEIMGRESIEHIRDTYSSGYKRAPKDSPWTTNFDEMAKKTVVRRLFKMLPTSIEIRQAITLDEEDHQENAKIIDPQYEILPPALDPARGNELRNHAVASDRFESQSAMDSDRKMAINAFELSASKIKDAGGDPEKILGMKILDILQSDAATIQMKMDLLELRFEEMALK